MYASSFAPPFGQGSVHFAEVVDQDKNAIELQIEGVFTCAPIVDKFSKSIKKIFFKPTDLRDPLAVDGIFAMEDLGMPNLTVSKTLKDGSLCLKIPNNINLDNAKGKHAKVSLIPGLYVNSKDLKAGAFYKLVEVKFE